ncbi:hypothetical protein FRX31_003895 [Thalictrum thalictroides]|uniref:Uncharacterized protein n=1 Tax=Thalictrum thalictroides TaxID=46969 RepID=A0A7J6XC76_THATH|nr:hypothetical protein FRX31_003895 [Thalictrum thalictroides]
MVRVIFRGREFGTLGKSKGFLCSRQPETTLQQKVARRSISCTQHRSRIKWELDISRQYIGVKMQHFLCPKFED